jgi:hypothetical protein
VSVDPKSRTAHELRKEGADSVVGVQAHMIRVPQIRADMGLRMVDRPESLGDRSDGLTTCPICGELNYAATSAGMIRCRNCRSVLLVQGGVVEVLNKSTRYMVRRWLGSIFLGIGAATFLFASTVALLTRPSPLFGDCFRGCHNVGPTWTLAGVSGLVLIVVGVLLRRRRWL